MTPAQPKTDHPGAFTPVISQSSDRMVPLPSAPVAREERVAAVLRMEQKRVWGRRASLEDMERIVKEVAPIVREAARQPAVAPMLAQIARDRGVSIEAAREYWCSLHEADLMLEAGGDTEEISSAGAVGVAQWMPSTATEHGLKVELKESQRLTAQIEDLDWRIAWITYLQRPDADRNALGKPALTDADFTSLASLKAQRTELRSRRRRVDDRYDPRIAIFAHTRYMLSLYTKFPSMDWVFQAYHGGEGGVRKELRLYLNRDPLGSAADAIRTGNGGGLLTYEDVYFGMSPRNHLAAFKYIYGRLDDHRHYWWKLLSAQEAIAAYRRDPVAFAKTWESLLPGRRKEAIWYPDAPSHSVPGLAVLQTADTNHLLKPVLTSAGLVVRPAPLDPENTRYYNVLLPVARGTLQLVVSSYRATGGTGLLRAGDLTVTSEYAARMRALHAPLAALLHRVYPPAPTSNILPGGGPPADFDYHTTGLAFDLLAPSDKFQREILDYVLDDLNERGIITVTEAHDNAEFRFHVVPNPLYAAALCQLERNR